MATGPVIYAALHAATNDLPAGSKFAFNVSDSLDLRKLKPSDLRTLKFDGGQVERISTDLREGDFSSLGDHMGLKLSIDPDAPPLIPGDDA